MSNFNYLFKQLNLIKLQNILLNDRFYLVGIISSSEFFNNNQEFKNYKTFIFKNSYLSYLTSKTSFFPKDLISGKCVIISFKSREELEAFNLKKYNNFFQALFFSQDGVIFNLTSSKIQGIDKEALLNGLNLQFNKTALGIQQLFTNVRSSFYLQLLFKNKN
jgi:hypothetical protein